MGKIIIFTCAGGGGHLSASGALEHYLHDSYQVNVVNMLTDVLHSYDIISVITRRRFSSEQFYNMLIRKRQLWLINLIYPLGRIYFWLMQYKMEKTIEQYIRSQKPDLVISVIVLVNRAILEACKATNIPFFLSMTDLEPQAFLVKMGDVDYQKFRMNVPFRDAEIVKKIADRGIQENQIEFLGFPLRPAFFKKYDAVELRKQYQLDPNIPVVLISMGAQGSIGLLHAVKALKALPIPAQLVITVGNSVHLREKLEAITMPPWIFPLIVENTISMAELMAMEIVAVIKAGSTTFCEAIQMGCPLLLDATITPPLWESFNYKFVKKYKIGDCFTSYDQLPCMVEHFLVDENYRQRIGKNLAVFKRSDPAPAFNELVHKLRSYGGQEVAGVAPL